MSFQTVVNRAYTTGFPGDIVRDGPTRGKVGRIVSPTVNTDPANSTNRMSRAFGFVDDYPHSDAKDAYAAQGYEVTAGGVNFFGILGHPKAQALYGSAGDALAPTTDLPMGAAGEFYDMVTGMVVELFNAATTAQQVQYGDAVGYVNGTADALANPQAVPFGGLVALAPGAAAPTGVTLIPNARIISKCVIQASAAGAAKSTLAVVQLTQ